MRVHKILTRSMVDGPGERVVLFLAGCPIRCPGCQSRHLWDPESGRELEIDEVTERLLATGLPITISGGEPFAQAQEVADLLIAIKIQEPEREILVFSGFVFEDLMRINDVVPGARAILTVADILVDGPYIAELDDPFIQWRGSRNQRAIDLQTGRLLNWDRPTITISADGRETVGAAGLMRALNLDGMRSRKCGESL